MPQEDLGDYRLQDISYIFETTCKALPHPDRGRLRRLSRPPKVYLLMSNKQSHGGLGDGGGAICHRAGSPGGRLIQQMHVTPQQPALLGPRELKTRVKPVLPMLQ